MSTTEENRLVKAANEYKSILVPKNVRGGVTKFERHWFGDELYISHDVLVKYHKWEAIIKEINSIVKGVIAFAGAVGVGAGAVRVGAAAAVRVGAAAAAATTSLSAAIIAGMALFTGLFLLYVKSKDKGHGVILRQFIGIPITVVIPQPAPEPYNRRRIVRTPERAA